MQDDRIVLKFCSFAFAVCVFPRDGRMAAVELDAPMFGISNRGLLASSLLFNNV